MDYVFYVIKMFLQLLSSNLPVFSGCKETLDNMNRFIQNILHGDNTTDSLD